MEVPLCWEVFYRSYKGKFWKHSHETDMILFVYVYLCHNCNFQVLQAGSSFWIDELIKFSFEIYLQFWNSKMWRKKYSKLLNLKKKDAKHYHYFDYVIFIQWSILFTCNSYFAYIYSSYSPKLQRIIFLWPPISGDGWMDGWVW